MDQIKFFYEGVQLRFIRSFQIYFPGKFQKYSEQLFFSNLQMAACNCYHSLNGAINFHNQKYSTHQVLKCFTPKNVSGTYILAPKLSIFVHSNHCFFYLQNYYLHELSLIILLNMRKRATHSENKLMSLKHFVFLFRQHCHVFSRKQEHRFSC